MPVLEFSGYAELDGNDYRISKSLRTATIQGLQIEGYDGISDEEMTINLDGKWTSSEGLVKVRQTFEQSGDGYKYVARLSGTQRAAEATLDISGDIDISLNGDSDYASAALTKVKQGLMIRVNNY